MKNFKLSLITSVLLSIIIFIYLAIKSELTNHSISDTFFIVSLFFLIVGVALWIFASGFFDHFQRSMKMHFRFKKKNEPKDFIPLSEIGQAHQLFWLETGGILLIVAIVSLLFYFL